MSGELGELQQALDQKVRIIQCPLCHGSRSLPSDSNNPEMCWYCEGRGEVSLLRYRDVSELFAVFVGNYQSQVHLPKEQVQEMLELLQEVVEKRGAYSKDHLQHAENVIENASERTREVTDILKDLLSEK